MILIGKKISIIGKKFALHPLFEEILTPYYPGIIYSNGVRQVGGIFYVPRSLASVYDGPGYSGRVIIVEDEKGGKE